MKSVEKKHRRFLAAILTLCLLLGLCPLTPSAQAEETTTTTVAGSTTIEDAQSVPIGESVTTTLNDGNNYYAIPGVKAGQQVHVSLDKSYTGVTPWIYSADGKAWGDNRADVCTTIGEESGTYYLSLFARNAQTPMEITFFVTLYDNDKYEPNDSIETATQIQSGQSIDFTLLYGDSDYFAITTTKQSQFISVQAKSAERFFVDIYDSTGAKVGSDQINTSRSTVVFCTSDIGTYYLRFSYYHQSSLQPITASFVSTLLDNDTNEPNDTKAAATELHDGENTEFTVAGSDTDYFKVVTTKPGQDIALTVSGYNYANKNEGLDLYFDPAKELDTRTCTAYADISANETFYFHAVEAGEHYIALRNDTAPISCTRNLSVQILDGDQNEPNDTKENATPLAVGTDKEFMVGGFGDEDWFSFEAAPNAGEKKLYTLSFLDLNTDYSDEFFYEVYAPDGTPVVRSTRVNIRHINAIGCDRQGQYLVRVYTTAAKGTNYFASVDGSYNGRAMDYKRSALRICVSEGGDDPYESNDTWLTAANVPVGNIQHVLASTADADWFCFTVPENDMTLHLTSAKRTNAALYRAEDLMEQGDGTFALFSKDINYIGHYKLTDAGVYYLKLTADSGYISPDIRTTGIELLPATDEENNDTWKKATPLYEGMPRTFTLSAGNDVDWFKIVVPENGTRLSITATYSPYISLYREKDFQTAGDNAGQLDSWDQFYHATNTLNAGIYYLKVTSNYNLNKPQTIQYNILPDKIENDSLESAKTLNPGEWTEYYTDEASSSRYYFYIGTRKVGDVVRVSSDKAGWSDSCYLMNSAGKTLDSSSRANYSFVISEDGEYYICSEIYRRVDDNGRLLTNRLRYDIGSGEEKVSAIESADSLTLLEGEEMFLDLRCAPYGASSGNNRQTFDVYGWSDDCVEYDSYSGYLTAKSAGAGTLTVWLNGDSSVKKEIPVTVLAKDSLKALGVSIANVPGTLTLGTSVDLTAAYTLKDGVELTNPQKAVTWTSSDPKVLYVSPGGKVTAVGGGTATVTASVGGMKTSASITVTAAAETPQETVSSIKLNKYSLTLYMNEEGEQLTATIQPASFAKSIVWNSSDTKVASVSDSGLVTAVGPGTCIISATAGDRHVSATVSVLAARVRVTGVSFSETKHEIPMGGTATLTATITPADATVKTLVWTSDDPGIASVSRTGIVTAVSVGTTKIHATSVDGNHSAEVTVTVTAAPQLGDVNGDGYIDSADAMLCLRYSVGLAKELTEEQEKAADVNKDGFVDAGDAIKILRYDAKLIDSLN